MTASVPLTKWWFSRLFADEKITVKILDFAGFIFTSLSGVEGAIECRHLYKPRSATAARALRRPAGQYICPNKAIEMRAYTDVTPIGATLEPMRGAPSIIGTSGRRIGRVKRFKPPISSSPWRSIVPFPDEFRPSVIDAKSATSFGEEIYPGVDILPATRHTQIRPEIQ